MSEIKELVKQMRMAVAVNDKARINQLVGAMMEKGIELEDVFDFNKDAEIIEAVAKAMME